MFRYPDLSVVDFDSFPSRLLGICCSESCLGPMPSVGVASFSFPITSSSTVMLLDEDISGAGSGAGVGSISGMLASAAQGVTGSSAVNGRYGTYSTAPGGCQDGTKATTYGKAWTNPFGYLAIVASLNHGIDTLTNGIFEFNIGQKYHSYLRFLNQWTITWKETLAQVGRSDLLADGESCNDGTDVGEIGLGFHPNL